MSLQQHIDRVRSLVEQVKTVDPGYSLTRSYFCMSEEVGEVATALNVELGGKQREVKETSAQEVIDVILCCIEYLTLSGWSDQDIDDYMNKKIEKWEKRVRTRLRS